MEADQACAELRRRITSATCPTPRTSLVVADRISDVLIGRSGRGTEAVRLWTDYLFGTTDIVSGVLRRQWTG